MFDSKINTMGFEKMTSLNPLAVNESITPKSHSMRSERRSNDNSSVEDTNSMFTKFAFPFKLHSILESADASGQESIISWLPSGKAFKIHKPKEFADVIMPQYFNQTKYRSFQRQLYIYGFDRIKDKSSDDYGAYFHELFIRGSSDLCLDMQRKKIKGTGLSNEERKKKASMLRANSKPSSNRRSLKAQIDISQQSFSNTNQAPMHSGNQTTNTQSIFANLGLNTFSTQMHRQTPTTVIKSAFQAQDIANRQDNLNTIENNMNNKNIACRLPQFNKLMKGGRRCSLGFVRGTRMGRRGSFLIDGDEVLFGDKKFFFTNQY